MHNAKGRQAAVLGTFSGLITVANAEDLPAGGSPRAVNVDFTVGGARTRGSLINPFTYQNNADGPSPGNAAVDVSIGVNPWANPGAVLSVGGFATSKVGPLTLGIVSVAVVKNQATQVPGGGGGGTIEPTWLTVVTFNQNVPAYVQGQLYSFAGLTGDVGLNGETLAPYTGTGVFRYANQAVFEIGNAAYPTTPDTGTAVVSGLFMGTDAIDVTEFAFSVPPGTTPQGFSVVVDGFATAPATLTVQMLKAGAPVGEPETIALPVGTAAAVTLGGINDLFRSTWSYADLNNVDFGLRLSVAGSAAANVSLGYTTVTAYFTPVQVNFDYVTTFEDAFGNIKTLALDAAGDWWMEDVTNNPGVLAPLMSGAPGGSFASSFTANSRQYIATSDLKSGVYVPQQYNGRWTDRVSQVGPGAAPVFTPISASATQYAIAAITQPAPKSQGYSYFLQSSGPGSTSPGNVVTIYYLDSTVVPGPDADLVAAFNSGYPVYLYVSFTGAPLTQGPYVVQVTSVGEGQPPGQPRQFYYFTYNLPSVGYTYYQGSGHAGYSANYQRTLATMTSSVPIPGLEIGGVATVSGSSVANYNNPWTITQTPNAAELTITQTQVSGGVATFSYALVSGTAPVAGELVTISGTNNANGQLNLVNAAIVSASGGSNGTFTVNVSLPDVAATLEQGQATTAGTIFCFDPGAALVGSATNPIYGNAVGGNLTFAGTGQFMAAGTRQGVVFFITRNGYWTRPSPPVTFAAAGDTLTGIQVANLPIGPPNVIARGIAFTEAGANGVPGANFYTIPAPVDYVVDNVSYTATALMVNDNTSTSATFSFSDAVLLNAEEIDIQGANLFNLGELPEACWATQYAGRTVWGRVRTKVQNFLNLSFDGGYLANPGGNLLPLGWQVDNSTVVQGASPTLLVSPVFGNSLYLRNNSANPLAVMSMLYQSAYQDWNQVAILGDQTAYSVRVRCRTPSSAAAGALMVDLTSWSQGTGWGKTYGTFTVNLAAMSSAMATYEGTLLTDDTLNIPAGLMLRVWAANMPVGADIEIDAISIFPAEEPTALTSLSVSYQADPESMDLVTGGIDTSVVNAQPANGAFTLRDQLYIVKESSLVYVSATENQEPANWNPPREVSNVAGACGPNAYDVGEEWAVMACRNGLFLFDGGQPLPIQVEIPDVWRAIHWAYGHTICVRNDVAKRRLYIAAPLATPNPWMPDAPENANPTTPNVVMMMNYQAIGSIQQLMMADPLHVTMFGRLAALDIRRKWSLWTVPAPYIGLVKRNELLALTMFCNGIGSSKIYYVGDQPTGNDDGAGFRSSYGTYGFVDDAQSEQNPMLGAYNKRWTYYDLLANGAGKAQLTFYQNALAARYPYSVPGGVGLTTPAANDYEGPLNEFAERLFVEIAATNGWFNLSRLTLVGSADAWAQVRGA